MVSIRPSQRFRVCRSCNKDSGNMVIVAIRNDLAFGGGTDIVLCETCMNELVDAWRNFVPVIVEE